MIASIIIPSRPRSDFEAKIHSLVAGLWWQDFASYELLVGDYTAHDHFNRSAVRNDLAGMARSDVLIFADADTLYVDKSQISRAVKTAHLGWSRVSDYYMLDQKTTESWVLDEEHEIEIEKILFDPPGGIQVCTAEQFHSIGGFDEGFDGWGYEDTAFIEVMTAAFGPGRFHGDVFHLWHPKERSERQAQPKIRQNLQRFIRYQEAAKGGKGAIMEYLKRLERID